MTTLGEEIRLMDVELERLQSELERSLQRWVRKPSCKLSRKSQVAARYRRQRLVQATQRAFRLYGVAVRSRVEAMVAPQSDVQEQYVEATGVRCIHRLMRLDNLVLRLALEAEVNPTTAYNAIGSGAVWPEVLFANLEGGGR